MKLRYVRDIPAGTPRHDQRAFLSIIPDGDGYIAACRDFSIEKHDTETEIHLLQYDRDFNILDDLSLGRGNDPRIFRRNGKISIAAHCSDYNGDCLNWIFESGVIYDVFLKTPKGVYQGKNWTPISGFVPIVIRSLDPLVVYSILGDGKCLLVAGEPSRKISECRGGTAADYRGGKIVGFGHRTVDGDHHSVFGYTIDPVKWAVKFEDVPVEGLDGYNVVDPTSEWGNYVAVSACELAWTSGKPIRNCLMEKV